MIERYSVNTIVDISGGTLSLCLCFVNVEGGVVAPPRNLLRLSGGWEWAGD